MTDDELRALLRTAHEEDRPPPFAVGKRRWPRWPAVALVAAAAVFFILLFRKPAFDEGGIGMRETSLRLPLDGFLHLPGAELLSGTPRFDLGGLP